MSDKPELDALLQSAIDNNPLDFKQQVSDILGQRVVDALERRKEYMAQTMFNSNDSEEINRAETETEFEEPTDGQVA